MFKFDISIFDQLLNYSQAKLYKIREKKFLKIVKGPILILFKKRISKRKKFSLFTKNFETIDCCVDKSAIDILFYIAEITELSSRVYPQFDRE